jgi:hypothetical protein
MSDKPKPGKDKDLRYIRLAMDASQTMFEMLSERAKTILDEGCTTDVTEAFLLVTDQLDGLDHMLIEPSCLPTAIIEQNRQMRRLIRSFVRTWPQDAQLLVTGMAQAAGAQLQALLVVKEIRQT